MPDVIAEVTAEFLRAFVDAWNRHDVDALMSFMTDECVVEASAASLANHVLDVSGTLKLSLDQCELHRLLGGQ